MKEYFLLLTRFVNAKKPELRQQLLVELIACREGTLTPEEKANLGFFSSWLKPLLYEMVNVPGFNLDPKWISKQVLQDVKPQRVEKELQELFDLGFLKDPKNNTEPKSEIEKGHDIKMTDQIAALAAMNYHREMMQKAVDCFGKVRQQDREFNSLTVTLDAEQQMEAKKIILEACQKVFELNSKPKKGPVRVFQWSSQLFPFTRKMDKE